VRSEYRTCVGEKYSKEIDIAIQVYLNKQVLTLFFYLSYIYILKIKWYIHTVQTFIQRSFSIQASHSLAVMKGAVVCNILQYALAGIAF
jgi:hypothetical protein